MFFNSQKNESENSEENLEGELFYEFKDDHNKSNDDVNYIKKTKSIAVGDFLPYGPRMYHGTGDVVRMKDIAVKKRVLIIGAIGSFTPDCWNRHLYLVLSKLKYLKEREVDNICCITTNDSYTQKAWGIYLGCQDAVFMWADVTKRFTQAIGMDVVVPWLDDSIRSKRYLILADDMKVTKILVAPDDDFEFTWCCEHLENSDK